MTRKILFFSFLLIFLSSLIAVDVAKAEEEKIHYTIGLKTWFNSWNLRQKPTLGTFTFGEESNTVTTVGPVINIRRGKYFIGTSFLIGLSEYERVTSDSTIKATNEKQDFDVAAGYYFDKNLAVFIGYKYAKWDTVYSFISSGNMLSMETITQHGPLIGLTANYPIRSTGFTPFVTYSHYFLRRSMDDVSKDRFNETGPSIETGVAYAYRSYTATAGYKYQNFYVSESSGVESRYRGFMFSLNRTF